MRTDYWLSFLLSFPVYLCVIVLNPHEFLDSKNYYLFNNILLRFLLKFNKNILSEIISQRILSFLDCSVNYFTRPAMGLAAVNKYKLIAKFRR